MTPWENIAILAAQISGQCSCHIRGDVTLASLGLIGDQLATFVNRLQEIYGIMIDSSAFLGWVNLGDVTNYISSVI